MAKRIKNVGRACRKINVTGRPCRKITAKEVAKGLGVEIVTNQKEIAELKKKFPQRP